MKLRESLNNNSQQFTATVCEDNNKIVVTVHDTFNHLDNITDKRHEFNTIAEYENWKSKQDWIKTINFVSDFKGVK